MKKDIYFHKMNEKNRKKFERIGILTIYILHYNKYNITKNK